MDIEDNGFLRRVGVAAVTRHLTPNDKQLSDVFKNTERLISDLISIIVKEIESIDEDINYWVKLSQGSEWEVTLARWNLIVIRKVFGISWTQKDELPEWNNKDKVENYIINLKNIKSRVVRFLFDVYSSGRDLKYIFEKIDLNNIHVCPINQINAWQLTSYEPERAEVDSGIAGVAGISGGGIGGKVGFLRKLWPLSLLAATKPIKPASFEFSSRANSNDTEDSIADESENSKAIEEGLKLVEFSREKLYNCNTTLYRAINGFLYDPYDTSHGPEEIKSSLDSPIRGSSLTIKQSTSMKNMFAEMSISGSASDISFKDFVVTSKNNNLYIGFDGDRQQSTSDANSSITVDITITIPPGAYSTNDLLKTMATQLAAKGSGIRVKELKNESNYKESSRKIIFWHEAIDETRDQLSPLPMKESRAFFFINENNSNSNSIYDLIGIKFGADSTCLRSSIANNVFFGCTLQSICSSEELEFSISRRLEEDYLKNKSFLDRTIITSSNNKLHFKTSSKGGYEESLCCVEVETGSYYTHELIEKLGKQLKDVNFTIDKEYYYKKQRLKISHNCPFSIEKENPNSIWDTLYPTLTDTAVAEEKQNDRKEIEYVLQPPELVRYRKLLYNKDADSHPMDEFIVPKQYRKPGTLERYWIGILLCTIGVGALSRKIILDYDVPSLLKSSFKSLVDGIKEVYRAVERFSRDAFKQLSSVKFEMDEDERALNESYKDLIKSKDKLNELLDDFFDQNKNLQEEFQKKVDASVNNSKAASYKLIDNTEILDSVKTPNISISAEAPLATGVGDKEVIAVVVSSKVDRFISFIGPYGLNQVVGAVKFVDGYLRDHGLLPSEGGGVGVGGSGGGGELAHTDASYRAVGPVPGEVIESSANIELSSSNPELKLDEATKIKLNLVAESYDKELDSPIKNVIRGNLQKSVAVQFQNIKYKTEFLILKLDEIMQKNRFYIIILSVMAPLTILGSASMYAYRKIIEYLYVPQAQTSNNSNSQKLHGALIKARQSFERSLYKPSEERGGGQMLMVDTAQYTPRKPSISNKVEPRTQFIDVDTLSYNYHSGMFFYYLYILKQEALQFYVVSKFSKLNKQLSKRVIKLRSKDDKQISSLITSIYEGLYSAWDFLSAVWKCIPFVGNNKYNSKYGPNYDLIMSMRRDIGDLEDSFVHYQNEKDRKEFVSRTFSRMSECYPCFCPVNLTKNDSFV